MPPQNATLVFLGDKSAWPALRIRLHDVQALWGGRVIHVSGSGRVVMQSIDRAKRERRHEFVLSADDLSSLVQVFIDHDFVSVEIEDRFGIPDEAHPEIALVNPAGRRHIAAKWAGQKHEGFDAIHAEFLKLERRAQSSRPIYAGEYEPGFEL